MTIRELIRRSKSAVSGKLKFQWISRLYGSPLFKRKKNKISIEEVKDVQEALLRKGIFSQVEEGTRNYYLKVIRGANEQPKRRYLVNILLFVLTILTTSMTGAMLRGHNPLESYQQLSTGFAYSFALLAILLVHEMGHYTASRVHGIKASLPYFIPFFLPVFHPGTLGAFIKMKSSIPDRRALFDVGVAGPLAGFVMSVIMLSIGFIRLPDVQGLWDYIGQIHPPDAHGINLTLGNSLLYDLLTLIFNAQHLPMNEMYHFPFLFAGWFGLLVTAINLMPIGQLDGGHITYAMFGDRARLVAIGAFLLFIVLNAYVISNFQSFIWVLWIFLILIFIRFRHPPTLNEYIDLDIKRKTLGWLAYVIFILCFVPLPVYIP